MDRRGSSPGSNLNSSEMPLATTQNEVWRALPLTSWWTKFPRKSCRCKLLPKMDLALTQGQPGEMTQQCRALAAPSEDLGSIPGIHTAICNSSPREPSTLLSSYLTSTGLVVMHVTHHIHAGKNVHASFKNWIIKLSRKQGIHEGQPKAKQNNKPSLAMKDSVKP